ncbi:MAG: GMP/IMP nucleotidase [Proteobacteria bacterium SW_6_67_9]|nr:MAG: GMP/IMP nucleotidase [Proteobacteria bacterium SW_6_67_9]
MTRTPIELPWQCIDTVLLDLDGTLLDLYFDNHFFGEHLPRRLAAHWGIDVAAARADLTARYKAVEGTLDWYCLDYWHRELGIDLVELKAEIGELVQWRAHAPAFLERLAAAGKRRVLATNAHPGSTGFKFERLALAEAFDAQYSAHDVGAAKESQAFWRALHAREGFDVERTLFVDDNPAVLAAARAFGLPQLLGIRRPDSSQPARALKGFTAVDDFDEVEAPRPS